MMMRAIGNYHSGGPFHSTHSSLSLRAFLEIRRPEKRSQWPLISLWSFLTFSSLLLCFTLCLGATTRKLFKTFQEDTRKAKIVNTQQSNSCCYERQPPAWIVPILVSFFLWSFSMIKLETPWLGYSLQIERRSWNGAGRGGDSTRGI